MLATACGKDTMAHQREYGKVEPAQMASEGGLAAGEPARNSSRSRAWKAVFFVSIAVFLVAVAVICAIVLSYWQGRDSYRQVAEEAFPESTAQSVQADLSSASVDWDALLAVNPDTVGWIYVPGTPCNYPIVQASDDSKYLTTDFNGGHGWLAQFGCIFLSSENEPGFTDANNIVFGHHMNDGSMFAFIDGLFDPAAFNSTRDVYILTPKGNLHLRTFAIVHANENDPIAQISFATPEELSAYAEDKAARSAVQPDPQVDLGSLGRIFSFVTCDNVTDEGREVLFATVVESTLSAEDGAPKAAVEASSELTG